MLDGVALGVAIVVLWVVVLRVTHELVGGLVDHCAGRQVVVLAVLVPPNPLVDLCSQVFLLVDVGCEARCHSCVDVPVKVLQV